MGNLTLYGADYSVYVRIARLVLEELGFAYDRVPVDIFNREDETDGYRSIHPFGKIPALDHDGWRIYETDAIAHYLIALHSGGLLPYAARERGRTIQMMRIADNYIYPRLVWGVYVEETEKGASHESLAPALAQARAALDALTDIAGEPYLAGHTPTLADLWVYPMLVLFDLAPSGRAMLADFPRLTSWMTRMAERPSAMATRFPAEHKGG